MSCPRESIQIEGSDLGSENESAMIHVHTRGEGGERDIQKKNTVERLVAILFNVGPCPQRLATANYRRQRIVATSFAHRTRTSASGARIDRTKDKRWG